jgi:uncharacterized protein DUF3182
VILRHPRSTEFNGDRGTKSNPVPFSAPRRNYDVGQGIDERSRSGVFEASWRSGGATTAQLATLMAFADDPTLKVVEVTPFNLAAAGHDMLICINLQLAKSVDFQGSSEAGCKNGHESRSIVRARRGRSVGTFRP